MKLKIRKFLENPQKKRRDGEYLVKIMKEKEFKSLCGTKKLIRALTQITLFNKYTGQGFGRLILKIRIHLFFRKGKVSGEISLRLSIALQQFSSSNIETLKSWGPSRKERVSADTYPFPRQRGRFSWGQERRATELTHAILRRKLRILALGGVCDVKHSSNKKSRCHRLQQEKTMLFFPFPIKRVYSLGKISSSRIETQCKSLYSKDPK